MALSLGPIRIAKRQWKRPWSTDPFGQDDARDPEKHALVADDESDYDESVTSSRATSNSHDPMLNVATPTSSSSARRMASAYDDRIPRRKFNLYFSLALGSAVLLFILMLTRESHKSAEIVATAPPPPPKPSPYESFPFLTRYYGGIRTLASRSQNVPEYPGDEEKLREDLLNATVYLHETAVRRRQVDGEEEDKDDSDSEIVLQEVNHNLPSMKPFDPFVEDDLKRQECYLDAFSTIQIPKLQTYDGCINGFPDHVLGSYDMFGLRNDVCFDRFGRLGPYGFGYSRKWGGTGAGLEGDTEGAEQVWSTHPEVDYSTVNWADVVSRCAQRNKHRFAAALPKSSLSSTTFSKRQISAAADTTLEPGRPDDSTRNTPNQTADATEAQISSPKKTRTCVVIRTWHDYDYRSEDLIYLRSLVAELSLASGTEYVLHFLIQVKNNELPIWSNDDEYERVLNQSLPLEFRGMGTLWTDPQLMLLYSSMPSHPFRDIHLHGAYRSTFMPMQYFAHKHPEFDFFWHWEMDVRYTGHWYQLFDRTAAWAKEQPRKGLWERNARFYVPSVHGSWEDFRQMVRVQTEHGTSSKANMRNGQIDSPASDPNNPSNSIEKPVWGPEVSPIDNIDNSQDPIPPTTYAKDAYTWGVGEEADLITFNPLFDPENTDWNLEKDVTGYNTTERFPPRRAAIITASRLSKRLLATMHHETSYHKHTMFSEMWPASCALHHGLKAVYAPHPVFVDRRWPTDYLAAVFNGGRNGASGGARSSAFNENHESNFKGITWYYNSGFSGNLWRRWLGYKVNNDGGEAYELANEGRMCLPPMLLHPVKPFELIYEHREEETEEVQQSAVEAVGEPPLQVANEEGKAATQALPDAV